MNPCQRCEQQTPQCYAPQWSVVTPLALVTPTTSSEIFPHDPTNSCIFVRNPFAFAFLEILVANNTQNCRTTQKAQVQNTAVACTGNGAMLE